ncbi:hypothetical protein Agub_g471 [Astrephomene gubernaculifera]|uniref:BPL/LPL catalytic domain-containing protein n=1 Tax=Astrephomene gubernaculifera TaxID=47775 RepID=A0AAD3DEG8_9CHLO|nr:hypothetical protein Agub_g471 [Astrephomene gubernaculifera]
MRRVVASPLRSQDIINTTHRFALHSWTSTKAYRIREPTAISSAFASVTSLALHKPSKPLHRIQLTISSMSTTAALSAGANDSITHVLAVCRTPEDAERVAAVAKEIAAAAAEVAATATGGPATATAAPRLLLHLDASTLPAHAVPQLDAAACCRYLAGKGSLSRGSNNSDSHAQGGIGDTTDCTTGGGSSNDGAGCTKLMGRVLLAAPLLGSTQDLLRTHGSALGDGVVAVADRQTSGKGRGGNVWTSPPGCLMFSALRRLRVPSPASAPFINYLVCIAVTRGVRRALQGCGLPAVPLRIKWPNDIYAEGVKVGGALIHTTWQGAGFNVITGIGLNVNNRSPTTCLDELVERVLWGAAAKQEQEQQQPQGQPVVRVHREAVLAGILGALEEVYDTFEQSGFSPLESEYLAAWLHSGQVLDFDDSEPTMATSTAAAAAAATAPANGGSGSRATTRLTIRGLSSSGFLLAEDYAGVRYELTPDGNSLDMMQGLIRRKVV